MATRLEMPMSSAKDVGLEKNRYDKSSMDACYRTQSDPEPPPSQRLNRDLAASSPNLAYLQQTASSSNSTLQSDFSTYAERTISAPTAASAPFSSSTTSIDAVLNRSRDKSRPRALDKLKWRTKKRLIVSGFTGSENWQRNFPPQIFERIVAEIKIVHTSASSRPISKPTGCPKCYIQDLLSMGLTCKAWCSEMQKQLYTHIRIPDPNLIPKVGSKSESDINTKLFHRLIRFRRTLRSNPTLASYVRTLHVPDPIIPLYLKNEPNPRYDDYLCLLASIVMSCPNLESLSGFHPFYNHTFDRLTHAMSTRDRLKEYVWVITENDDISLRARTQLAPGLMDLTQKAHFLDYHQRWTELRTLMLCCPGKLGILEADVFARTMSPEVLPKLRNLCVSSFDKDDFTDETLLALPMSLHSLRVEECEGITDRGWIRWAASAAASKAGVKIERLSIIHQNITNLVTISKILAGLERLKIFTIAQSDVTPRLPEDISIVVQPLFANKTLNWLHWDIAQSRKDIKGQNSAYEQIPDVQAALTKSKRKMPAHVSPNMHLALSISSGGFPSLTHLRAPRDTAPLGILQSVCRPLSQKSVLLSRDQFSFDANRQGFNSNSLQYSRIRAQMVVDEMNKRKRQSENDVSDKDTKQRHGDVNQSGLEAPEGESGTNSSYSSFSQISNSTLGSTATNLTGPMASNSTTETQRVYSNDSEDIPGRDWDKEVVVQLNPSSSNNPTPRPRLRTDNIQRNSTCHCTPSPSTNRDSVCHCDITPTTPQSKSSFLTSRVAAAMKISSSIPSKPEVPNRSPLRQSVLNQSFKTPSQSQSNSNHDSIKVKELSKPIFHLFPDITDQDSNGGLAGNWGVLLNVGKRQKMASTQKEKKVQKNTTNVDLIDDDDDDDDDDYYSDVDKKNGNRKCKHRRRKNGEENIFEARVLKSDDFF